MAARTLDALVKDLTATVTERCRQRIAEARKHPKEDTGIFANRKRAIGL